MRTPGRAALAAVFLACLAPARAAGEPASASWLQEKLESGMSQALGGRVTIGRLDVSWTSLAATFDDVSIELPVEGAPPLVATIGRGRVKLAWSGIAEIGGGRIHIERLEAERPTLALSRAWVDAWKPRKPSGKAGNVEIRIDHVTIVDGAVQYTDAGQGVRVRALHVASDGDWSTYRRLLIGTANGDVEVEAPLFKTPWPAKVRGGVRVGAGRVEIYAARGEGPGATADVAAATVTWGAGTSFTLDGTAHADLAAVSPFLVGTLPLAGVVSGPVQIVQSGGPIRVDMPEASTTGLRIGPIVTTSATGAVTLRPGRLDVAGLRARAYEGEVSGSVALTLHAPMELTTDLTGRGIDLGRIVALTGRSLPLAASADATLAVRGQAAHPATWIGKATFDASPRARDPEGRLPLGGRGRIEFDSGRIRVESDDATLAAAKLTFGMTTELGPAPRVEVAIDGTTSDAAATQAAALRILDALGVARNEWADKPVSGRGTVRARVDTGPRKTFDLALDLTDGAWAGEPFDRARVALAVDPAAVTLRDVAVTREAESLSGNVWFKSDGGGIGAIDVRARDVALAPLLKRLGVTTPVEGRVDLDLRGDALEGPLLAAGRAQARGVTVGKEIVDTIDTSISIEGSEIRLPDLAVRGQGVRAAGTVLYDTGTSSATLAFDPVQLDLGGLRSLAEAGLDARGKVEIRGPMTVDRDGIHGFLTLAASQVAGGPSGSGLKEVQLGDLAGTAALAPEGAEISVRAFPRSEWTFEAFMGWGANLPISAVLYFDDLAAGSRTGLGEVRLKGQVAVEGELAAPKELQVNGAFDEVVARLGSREMRAVQPFPVRLEAGRLTLGPSRFEGEGASLEMSAAGGLETEDVEGRLKGHLDLGVVSSYFPELRGSGELVFDASLHGSFRHPDLGGKASVQDGRLRVLGYPQALEQIDATASLAGERVTLTSFHAFLGGGEISADGEVTLDGFAPAAWHATVDGTNVTASFPEGFRGVYEGRLTVDGKPKSTRVSGAVTVTSGLYSKDFQLTNFGGASRDFSASAESPFPRNIFLDVDLRAPGNLWLRNDIAKLEASGQLHVGGELARPEMTGRLIMFPGGTIRYRDVDYRLESGSLDLTDPKRLNPYLDVRGRTRVAEYEIGLRVEGTLDAFTYELTSTPPLSSQDIISLLVSGKTLDDLSSTGSAAALPGDMAAYYFAGLLTSTFGKQIQQSLGIDQLAITPLLLKGETDPTARVTLGKRVGNDVRIIFSQDIGNVTNQTYQVVWDASRQVRVLAESDADTGLGGEVQYARQFGGAKLAKAGVKGADAPGSVAWVRVVESDGVGRPDLVKKSRIKAGDAFDRSKVLTGADRIRSSLLRDGYVQAVVRPEVSREDPAAGYQVLYHLSSGPRTKIVVEAAEGKGKGAARRALKSFWKETPFTFEYWDEAARSLAGDLQADGYYAAEVSWTTEDRPTGSVVRFHVDRGPAVKLRSLRLHGVASVPPETVTKAISSLKSGTLRKRRLKIPLLTADLEAVKALYRDEGFARVRVAKPRIALTPSGDAADVDIDVDEGPRFSVRDVAIDGESPVDPDRLKESLSLRPGVVFSARRLTESEQAVRDGLDRRGFPDVSVDSSVALGLDTADVALTLDPGTQKRVGEIAIEGNDVTKDRTIAKALTFGEGDLLSKAGLLKSQQQLYRMGLFSNVRLSYEPLGADDPAAQRVKVHVEEAPPLSFSMGLGYDSQDGPRASVLLGYSNVAGRGIAMALQGLVSGEEERAQLTVRRRQVFGTVTDLLGSLLYSSSNETGFHETRRAFSVRWERRPKPRWIRYLRYQIEQVTISEITDPDQTINTIFEDKLSALRLSSLGVGLVRDTRDDPFTTTHGGYASIEGSVFSRYLGSEADFLKVFTRGSWTKSLPHGLRFASFLRIGAEYPFDTTNVVPLSERFFAGGAYSLRGFDEDSVGGLELEIGNPPQTFKAGGEAIILFNEELHFPIWRALKGEIFLDFGNVYESLGSIDWGSLRFRYSSGVGLRLDTPIGAIRVEYGWKLDRRDDETAGDFIVAIGTVF